MPSAVDIYLQYAEWVQRAAMNPGHADLATLRKIASGAAYTAAVNNLSTAVIWKGTPNTPRPATLATQYSGSIVTVRDCDKPGTLRPYYVSTGKPVPLQSNPVPPPYATTAQIVRTTGGWTVNTVSTDSSKTCMP